MTSPIIDVTSIIKDAMKKNEEIDTTKRSKMRHELKRTSKKVSFNTKDKAQSALLDFADTFNFSVWVKMALQAQLDGKIKIPLPAKAGKEDTEQAENPQTSNDSAESPAADISEPNQD